MDGRFVMNLGEATITVNTTGYDLLSGMLSKRMLRLKPPYILQVRLLDAGAIAPDDITFDCKLQHAVDDVAALYEDASIAVSQITSVGDANSSGDHSALDTPLRGHVRAMIQASSSDWQDGTTVRVTIIGNWN